MVSFLFNKKSTDEARSSTFKNSRFTLPEPHFNIFFEFTFAYEIPY